VSDVIRLNPRQTKSKAFDHELLDQADEMKSSKDWVLSRLWMVRWTVGKYLFHWTETERFTEDMVSEAILALAEAKEEKVEDDELWNRMQYAIETYLNDNRALVRASLSTNRRRAKKGQALEYSTEVSLHGVGKEDHEWIWVDHQDEEDTETNEI